MASSAVTAAGHFSSLVLGVCLPSFRYNASRVKIQHLYFDKHLLKYYRKSFYVFAYDPEKISKTGDIILIEELKKKMSPTVTHRVLEVVYPCGDVTDPLTGKKVVATQYRDELDAMNAMAGERESAFNYKVAPRRGWQEDRKDFTHRPIYRKYHEFDEGDENEHQPYASYY